MNKYALFLLIAGLAAAQVKPSETGPKIVSYEFKNVDIDRANEIVTFVRQLDPHVIIQLNGPFKTAILQPNGPLAAMDQALELFKHYDVAPPKVEFVAYLVRAAEHMGQQPLKSIPPEIEDAVAEMKKTFAYANYSLLDTVSTDVRHHAEVNSVFPQIAQSGALAPFLYHIVYGDTTISPDGKTVSVSPFKFSVREPDWPEATGFTTDVVIHAGQKLVLGKARTSITTSDVVFVILIVKPH
jgi:hypothetical protein